MIPLPGPVDLAQLVSAVTRPMLNLSFGPDVADRPWADLVWRAAVLNIPGEYPLSVGLSSDRAGCEKLCAAMFQVPRDQVDDEMLSDALRELVNMTAGLLKSHLKLDQALGLPRITMPRIALLSSTTTICMFRLPVRADAARVPVSATMNRPIPPTGLARGRGCAPQAPGPGDPGRRYDPG